MAACAILVVDETPTGQEVRRTELRLVGETASVRELVEGRVRAEVERWNQGRAGLDERWPGLVQPTADELALNQPRRPRARATVDADAQVAAALEAFARGRFLMFVGDAQVEDLDRVVELVPGLELRFIKLVPLVGG